MRTGISITLKPADRRRLAMLARDRNAPHKHVWRAITIVRPAAAAPPRRPEQVELRRARVFGDHPPRDKEHHLASRKCRRERARRRLCQCSGIWRSIVEDPVGRAAPAAAASCAPTARAPSLAPNWNSAKKKSATSVGSGGASGSASRARKTPREWLTRWHELCALRVNLFIKPRA
jgi:hypothetical protein